MESPKLVIRVTLDQKKQLDKYVKKVGLTSSSVMRLALSEFLEKKQREAKACNN